MSSRGKKKNIDVIKSAGVSLTPKTAFEVDKEKLNKTFNTIIILLVIILFAITLFCPIVDVSVEFDLNQWYEETTGQAGTLDSYKGHGQPSALDILLAPAQGLTNGLKYIAKQMNIEFKTEASYDVFVEVIKSILEPEYIDSLEIAAKAIYILAIMLVVAYIAMAIALGINRSKHKTKVAALFVTSIVYFVVALGIFVTTIIMYFYSASQDSVISSGWGIWIVLLAAMAVVGVEIWYLVKRSRLNDTFTELAKQSEIDKEVHE